jgi:hypothetical protein
MRKPYVAPTLSRYGAFGELTRDAGKGTLGNDLHPQFGLSGECNPNADPGSVSGCIS